MTTTDTAQPVRSTVVPPPADAPHRAATTTPQDGPGLSLYADIAAYLDGGLAEPPAPEFLRRSDDVCLFYAGQVNWLYGDPETYKTWVALAAVVEALKDDQRVLVLDLDHNGMQSTVSRLLQLGAPVARLRDRAFFRYAEPEDELQLARVVRDMASDDEQTGRVGWRPAVAVVDSVGELLPLLRLSSNSPDDFTTAHSRVLKPLARAGAAVIAIDHLAKNTESRAYGATGTAAKKRAVGGVSLRAEVIQRHEDGGVSVVLRVSKDRHGGLRRGCPAPEGREEPTAAVFRLTTRDDDTLMWEVHAPTGHERASGTARLDGDVTTLDGLEPPPASVHDVKARLKWGTTRASDALKAWRSRSGNVPEEPGTDPFPVPTPQGRGTGNAAEAAPTDGALW